jgi:hypothetical protein
LKKNFVSSNVQIVALPNSTYYGYWDGLQVTIPFDHHRWQDYEFQTIEPLTTKASPCKVVVADYDAIVMVMPEAKFSAKTVDGKLVFNTDL